MPSCSATHCLDIEPDTRRVLSWAKERSRTSRTSNRFGQLGRGRSCSLCAAPVALPAPCVDVSAGGGKDAGHSAAVTATGEVYTWGCDRWQQLGLGSPEAGAAGYTWAKGSIWQWEPQRAFVPALVQHVACGNDHTVALARDGCTVFTWGRGEHGQLGRDRALFVGAPARSAALSHRAGDPDIALVAAIGNCSATVDNGGNIIRAVGKCAGVRQQVLDLCRLSPPSRKLKS